MASLLVVEDDDATLRMLLLALRVDGHDVEGLTDGSTALARLSSAAVDLVLLDVMLPDVDGIEVLTRLRRSPGWERAKVVILTALGGDRDIWRGWSAGADYYLTKPFDLEQLRQVTGRLLDGEVPAGPEVAADVR